MKTQHPSVILARAVKAPSAAQKTILRFAALLLAALAQLAVLQAQSNYATPYTFTTIAGSPGSTNADGTGSAARFLGPGGVAMDSAGNIYVADTDNSAIRKMTPTVVSGVTNWVVTTIAGSAGNQGSADGTGSAARFNYPTAVAVDSADNVYVADMVNNTIRKITPTVVSGVTNWVVTTIAGSAGNVGSGDGTGSAAQFWGPEGVAVDSAGNVYVADSENDTIRKITPTVVSGVTNWVVTTIAGFAGNYGSADGTGSAAQFDGPDSVVVDGAGDLYVADTDNQTIRKITPTLVSGVTNWVVTTLAGSAGASGSADGTGSAAQFLDPQSVAVDSAGNLFVADTGNNTIRKITPTVVSGVTDWVVSTIAGNPDYEGWVDGTGSAAQFAGPCGVVVDGSGNLYVADTGNATIRKITPTVVSGVTNWVVTTIAGSVGDSGSSGYSGSADGTGSAAQFYSPLDVAVDGTGSLYVADTNNSMIRKITPTVVSGVTNWVVATLAGSAGCSGSADGTGTAAELNFPSDVAVDGSGNVYVADTGSSTIRKITPAGVVTTIAGSARNAGSADGTGSAAQFDGPCGVAVDGAGNLYVADMANVAIRKITPTVVSGVTNWVVTTIAGAAGNYGSADGTGSAAQFMQPEGVAVDSAGNVYVADASNYAIRKITPTVVSGVTKWVVTTIAGAAGNYGSADGTGSAAQFRGPYGVAVDGAGNVYVGDTGNFTIRKVTPTVVSGVTNWVVTTLAGSAGNLGSADGTGSAARFDAPDGLAVDGSGNLYVADSWNKTIREGIPPATPAFTTQPVNQAVTAGNNASFTAAASGVPTPTLQWQVSTNSGSSWTSLTNGGMYGGTATGTLTITGATLAMNGYQYQCLASNSVQSNVASTAATLTVSAANVAPAFTTQPVSQAVTAGNNASFTAAASGVPTPTLQWQVSTNSGSSWTSLTNGAPYSGTATGTLTITGATLAMNGYQYQCLASNSVQSNVASTAATLTVSAANVAPSITAQPGSQTVNTGSNASFSVAASGVPATFTYQWQRLPSDGETWANLSEGSPYTGTTTAILTVSGATTAMSGDQFRCIVSNGVSPNATSNAATLTVNPPLESNSLVLSNEAPGALITKMVNAGWGNLNLYQTLVDVDSDSNPSVSGVITPAFLQALAACPEGSAIFTTKLSDINTAGMAVAMSDDGTVQVVSIYGATYSGQSGCTSLTTSITSVTSDAQVVSSSTPGGFLTSWAGSANGVPTNYHALAIAWDATPAVIPVAPTITSQPASRTVTVGSSVNFTVVASGTPATFTYQWQQLPEDSSTWANLTEGGSYAGTATATLTVSSTAMAMSGDQFRCVVSNGVSPNATSNAAALTLVESTPLTVSTLAGLAGVSGGTDGTGSAARFHGPADVAVDTAGNVYVADTNNQTIRKVTPAGAVTTLAGGAGASGSTDGTGTAARFDSPLGVTVDGAGNVYVADTGNATIRKITSAGTVTTLAGQAGASGFVDGTGTAARFNGPSGLAVDAAGNLYVADTLNQSIRKITTAGAVSTISGTSGLEGPQGLALDSAGNLFVADPNSQTIRKVVLATGAMTVTAGQAGSSGSDDGQAGQARFNDPSGVAVDGTGNLYVTDTDNYTIREITPAGVVSTVAGLAGTPGSADGVGSVARFDAPTGITVNSARLLYIADTDNHTIRQGTFSTMPVITAQPQSQTVAAGASVQFSVTAVGLPAPSYQWAFNGVAISGATSSTLTLTDVHASDAGSYTVTVANSAGSVTSNAATLTVTAVGATTVRYEGGGGGAMEPWFLAALALLGCSRWAISKRRKGGCS